MNKKRLQVRMLYEIDTVIECDQWKYAIPHLRSFVYEIMCKILSYHMIQKKSASMEIIFTNDIISQEINKNFRYKNKPTNVLSFAHIALADDVHLGTLILAYQTIMREAKTEEQTIRQRVISMLIHGTLHLLGFDHKTNTEHIRMKSLEDEIMHHLRDCFE